MDGGVKEDELEVLKGSVYARNCKCYTLALDFDSVVKGPKDSTRRTERQQVVFECEGLRHSTLRGYGRPYVEDPCVYVVRRE